jgi:hypothetical protein
MLSMCYLRWYRLGVHMCGIFILTMNMVIQCVCAVVAFTRMWAEFSEI